MYDKILFAGGSEVHETLFYGEAENLADSEKLTPVAWYAFRVTPGDKKKKPYDLLRFITEDGELYTTFHYATISMFAVQTVLGKKKFTFTSSIE